MIDADEVVICHGMLARRMGWRHGLDLQRAFTSDLVALLGK